MYNVDNIPSYYELKNLHSGADLEAFTRHVFLEVELIVKRYDILKLMHEYLHKK